MGDAGGGWGRVLRFVETGQLYLAIEMCYIVQKSRSKHSREQSTMHLIKVSSTKFPCAKKQ